MIKITTLTLINFIVPNTSSLNRLSWFKPRTGLREWVKSSSRFVCAGEIWVKSRGLSHDSRDEKAWARRHISRTEMTCSEILVSCPFANGKCHRCGYSKMRANTVPVSHNSINRCRLRLFMVLKDEQLCFVYI